MAPRMVWVLAVACAALDCTLELAAEVDGAKELLEPAAAGAEPEAGLLAEADCEALFCGDVREAWCRRRRRAQRTVEWWLGHRRVQNVLANLLAHGRNRIVGVVGAN